MAASVLLTAYTRFFTVNPIDIRAPEQRSHVRFARAPARRHPNRDVYVPIFSLHFTFCLRNSTRYTADPWLRVTVNTRVFTAIRPNQTPVLRDSRQLTGRLIWFFLPVPYNSRPLSLLYADRWTAVDLSVAVDDKSSVSIFLHRFFTAIEKNTSKSKVRDSSPSKYSLQYIISCVVFERCAPSANDQYAIRRNLKKKFT